MSEAAAISLINNTPDNGDALQIAVDGQHEDGEDYYRLTDGFSKGRSTDAVAYMPSLTAYSCYCASAND